MYSNEKRSSKVFYESAQEEDPTVTSRHKRRQYEKSICNALGAKVPARLVLYFLSWSGFLVSFMMRNDINFALVAMTRPNGDLNVTTLETAKMNNTDQFDWSPGVKSVIISCFFCCYVLAQVVGGVATQYYGTKNVFGWSQLATAISSLLIPSGADWHFAVVIALRCIQGFASGLTWPAMYAIVAYWIPPSERSRFMSSFQGFSIGIGLTYPLCGFIINHFGWRYVFYFTGSSGICWCILWYLLAFNTPQEHPRITRKELDYIETNVSSEVNEALRMRVPWKAIVTSMPAWAIGITTFGRIWIHYIFIVSGPSFMKNILHFEYQTNGFLSGMPFICSYISAVFFCYIADKLMLHNLLSLTNVRKMFTALSQVVPGLLIYWIGYINNIELLLVIWFISVSLITASYAGAMANIVDIAPNFAGPVLAFCQTIHMSASFISPLVAGGIVSHETSIEEWRNVFGISSIVTVLTYIIYHIYGTAEIQKWNYAQPKDNATTEESQILKIKNEEIIPKST